MNKDLIGWLTIPGTNVDYPVVQTPWQEDYYLYRGFDGESNKNGCLILDGNADPYTPSTNLIIYGHKMSSGAMFGKLDEYVHKEYWQAHPVLQFDTLTTERSTQIEGGGWGSFHYYVNFDTDQDLADWLTRFERQRYYDTGIEYDTTDRYITLSTCSYHTDNGRLLVIARELREGETPEDFTK